MGPYILCLVTIDDIGKAGEIARALVENEIVACVNIIPEIRSIYRWKGEVCDEGERLMLMKTREELFPKLQTLIRELHPYDVPEIIALRIEHGLPEYLRWIDDCTARSL
jgi:periplasmic divalent cation tolerance protein